MAEFINTNRSADTNLSESQQRALLVPWREVDRSMTEIESVLSAGSAPSVFPKYQSDLNPVQARVIRDSSVLRLWFRSTLRPMRERFDRYGEICRVAIGWSGFTGATGFAIDVTQGATTAIERDLAILNTKMPDRAEPVLAGSGTTMNDSWQYRFAYLIKSSGEFPEDFPGFPEDVLLPALFLPRDEPNWLGRSANPPRVVVLRRDVLEVYFHPQSGKDFDSLRFDERLSIQVGRTLLVGWLGFASPDAEIKLPYNRRVDEPVRQFLGIVRARLLYSSMASSSSSVSESVRLGDSLELKFENVMREELDQGESAQIQLFIAPRPAPGRRWFLGARSWLAGDMIVVSARRIVWITERCRGAREIYGDIVSWAALENVSLVTVPDDRSRCELDVFLRNGKVWSIEVPDQMAADARRFVSLAMDRLQLLRKIRT